MPRTGLALGLALLVPERIPAVGDAVLPVVIASTVVFELLGPLVARWQLSAAHELPGPR